MDERIKKVMTSSDDLLFPPNIILENIWNEQFRIDYLILPSNKLYAHAVKL